MEGFRGHPAAVDAATHFGAVADTGGRQPPRVPTALEAFSVPAGCKVRSPVTRFVEGLSALGSIGGVAGPSRRALVLLAESFGHTFKGSMAQKAGAKRAFLLPVCCEGGASQREVHDSAAD